jgi:hypothetical protein
MVETTTSGASGAHEHDEANSAVVVQRGQHGQHEQHEQHEQHAQQRSSSDGSACAQRSSQRKSTMLDKDHHARRCRKRRRRAAGNHFTSAMSTMWRSCWAQPMSHAMRTSESLRWRCSRAELGVFFGARLRQARMSATSSAATVPAVPLKATAQNRASPLRGVLAVAAAPSRERTQSTIEL